MENIFYEHPEKIRPRPPQGGSGVINAPVKIDFDADFDAIIGRLNYIKNTTDQILTNLDNIKKQLGKVNIDSCMQLENDDDDLAWTIMKQLLDAIKRGNIKFTFSPN